MKITYTKQYTSPPLQGVRMITTETVPDDQVADRIAALALNDAGNPVRNPHGNDWFYFGITTQSETK